MTKPTWRWAIPATILSITWLFGTGCSDDADNGGAKDNGPPAAVTSLCADVAKARCAAAVSCCKGGQVPKSAEDCEKAGTEACVQGYKSSWDAVRDGRASVRAAAKTACIAAVNSAAENCLPPDPVAAAKHCGTMVADNATVSSGCKAAVAGLACGEGAGECVAPGGKGTMCLKLAAKGEACDPAACEPPLKCVPNGQGKTGGTCGSPSEAGGACKNHGDCAVGLACGATQTCEPGGGGGQACSGPGTCGAGFACDDTKLQCVPRVKNGEQCLAHRHCEDGLACTGLGLSGTCVKQSAIGAACSSSKDCADGLFCSIKDNKCTVPAGDGAACTTSDSCGQLLYCDLPSKSCKPLPGEGKACAYSVRQCLPRLTCYSVSKKDQTCVKPRKKGEKCTSQSNCGTGLGCDKGVCVDLPGVGSTCLDSMYCKDSYCDHKDGKVCKAFHKTGEKCVGGHECGPEGACVGTKADNLKCQALPTEGKACLLQCASGLFCSVKKLPGTCAPAICAMN